jgi:hypothetical protein
MHFYYHPTHAGTKTFHRAAMPKRRNRLSIRPDENLCTGWGLVFVERISWLKVAVVEGVIGIVSLIFAACWSRSHGRNISDAFAPSSWMVGLGAIILTLIYHVEQAT